MRSGLRRWRTMEQSVRVLPRVQLHSPLNNLRIPHHVCRYGIYQTTTVSQHRSAPVECAFWRPHVARLIGVRQYDASRRCWRTSQRLSHAHDLTMIIHMVEPAEPQRSGTRYFRQLCNGLVHLTPEGFHFNMCFFHFSSRRPLVSLDCLVNER